MQRVSFDRVDFFLGATTPAGFKGYLEPLRREPGMQMVLIKSGVNRWSASTAPATLTALTA